MIPLSNPLDTRSVWLRTGSERLRLVEGEQASRQRKRKDEGKAREQSCCSPLLLTEKRGGLGDPETCTFLVEGWLKKTRGGGGCLSQLLLEPNEKLRAEAAGEGKKRGGI